MAKVINPLLSGSASGQLGNMMTFDKRGYVRQYVVPSNPKTVGQMAVRNVLGDIQRELKELGTVLRAELKSGFGYRWNSVIIGELMANDNAALLSYAAEYTAFSGGNKTSWEGVDPATPVVRTQGELIYVCASAAYDIALRLGVTITLTLPAEATFATTGAEWVDSTP
jgi:hypothetical protein